MAGRIVGALLGVTTAAGGSGLYVLETDQNARRRLDEKVPGLVGRISSVVGRDWPLDEVTPEAKIAAVHPKTASSSEPVEQLAGDVVSETEQKLRDRVKELESQLDRVVGADDVPQLIGDAVKKARAEWDSESDSQVSRKVEDRLSVRKQEIEDDLKSEKMKVAEEVAAELERRSEARVNAMAEMQGKLDAIELAHSYVQKKQVAGESARRVALASFSFVDAANTGKTFGKEASLFRDMLEVAGEDAALTKKVLGSIPEPVIDHGAPTVAELQARFRKVATQARRASMVPDDGGFWAHLLATAVTAFKASEAGPHVEGDSTDARLARAEFRLAKNDLSGAISEVESVQSKVAQQLCHDWLESARARMLIDQAGRVLAAEAMLLQEAA